VQVASAGRSATGARRVADRSERPGGAQPRRHGIVKGDVQIGPIGPGTQERTSATPAAPREG
jgi:hypothetical protein